MQTKIEQLVDGMELNTCEPFKSQDFVGVRRGIRVSVPRASECAKREP